jgi:hypothetical protein
MAKRFQTYFGIPIPPFKKQVLGSGTTTIRFIIPGNIASKKNNQQAVSVRKDAKEFLFRKNKENGGITYEDAISAVNLVHSKIRGNDDYKHFVERCKPIIQEQAKQWYDSLSHKGLIFPLKEASMTLRLYFKDRYVTDTVNKQQSIQDLLVECGIIANDDYKTLNPIHSASACYYEELIHNIAFVSLTFKL